jgi:hypothetical protein
MATLRARLTVAYGFALVGGLIVFAVALVLVRVASGVERARPDGDRPGRPRAQPLRSWE